MSVAEQEINFRRARRRTRARLIGLAVLVAAALVSAGAIVMQQYTGDDSATVGDTTTEPEGNAPVTTVTAPVDREALQEALSSLRGELNALQAQTAFAASYAERAQTLSVELEQAYTDYGQGNFAPAQSAVVGIRQAAQTLRVDYTSAYTRLYEQAITAFAEDNISVASALNRKALEINPAFNQALQLQDRIGVYEKVMEAYEQARVGKVENNLQKQRRAYADIVKLDPQREDAKSALTSIEDAIQKEKFASLMQRAVDQLEADNADAAMKLVQQALALEPDSNAAATLKARITHNLKSQALAEAEAQIRALQQADEWTTVAMLGKSYLKTHPNSAFIQRAVHTADNLNEANAQLSVYLDAPDRLSDDNIRRQAKQALATFAGLRDVSTKFASKLDSLDKLIEQENAPVAVTITSDDKTYIRVLGVGVVGEVEEKVIRLKPGRYQFEGRREGYRTTLLEVDVTSAGGPVMVNLICTQRV